MSLNEEDRINSLKIIEGLAADADRPFFIAGDLNDTPDSQLITTMGRFWKILSPTDSSTFPADAPTVTIDYIAVRKQDAGSVELFSSEVIDESQASDHRPIKATVIIE